MPYSLANVRRGNFPCLDQKTFSTQKMEQEKLKQFLELLYKYGTNFDLIRTSKEYSKYSDHELAELYKKAIYGFGRSCVNKGGSVNIQQIKDIYSEEGEILMDVLMGTGTTNLRRKNGYALKDYKSKSYMLLKDYEFMLREKLSLLTALYSKFDRNVGQGQETPSKKKTSEDGPNTPKK
jgi:hypothetical protein